VSHWQGGRGWTPEQARRFRRYRGEIWVIADLDNIGAALALRTRDLLLGVGVDDSRLRLLRAAAGKDASEHLAAGYAPDAFVPVNMRRMRSVAATAPPPGRGRGYRTGTAA
jgi:DNA primase